jgi:hypothetical protein
MNKSKKKALFYPSKSAQLCRTKNDEKNTVQKTAKDEKNST